MVFNEWVIEFEFYKEEFYREENNFWDLIWCFEKLYVKKIINQDSISSNEVVPFLLYSGNIINH